MQADDTPSRDDSTHTDPYRDRELLKVDRYYEFTHGPSSTEERRERGILKAIDESSETYIFDMDDGSRVSLVWHEVQAPQILDEDP